MRPAIRRVAATSAAVAAVVVPAANELAVRGPDRAHAHDRPSDRRISRPAPARSAIRRCGRSDVATAAVRRSRRADRDPGPSTGSPALVDTGIEEAASV